MKLTRSDTVRVAALIALWVLVWAGPADAGRIRVLGATQVRIDATVRSDRSAVDVKVTVLDDDAAHPRPVRGRVSLRWAPDGAGGAHPPMREAQTDRDGQASFALPVTAAEDAVRVQAEFVGNDAFAPSQSGEQLIDLNRSFVRLDQPQVEPVVDADAATCTVRVHIVALLENPTRLEITLLADDNEIATLHPDSNAWVTFVLPVARVRQPGFHTLRAEYARGDNRVSSPTRRFVVRAATVLNVARAPGEGTSVRLLGALATATGPVGPGAAVRILQGRTLLGAGLTNEQGNFEIALDPETAARPDLVVHATFEPTEPWFLASESAPLRLTAPAPARVGWTLVAVPLACAALLLLALRFRRRRQSDGSVPVAMKPLDEGAMLERVSIDATGVVRVRLRAVDRATDQPVRDVRARWIKPPRGERSADDVVELDGIGRFEVELTAAGYAPRMVAGELSRGGEYGVRVTLRSWREELFERVRRWMRQSGAQSHPVLPTPREVLAARGPSARNAALVALVEAGTYGPDAPDAEAVRAADALVTSASSAPPARSADAD